MRQQSDFGQDRERRFREMFAAHHSAIRAYVLRRTGVGVDADDAVADVFLVAWRRFEDVPDDGTPQRLWLYGAARRVLANQRRGASRRRRLTDRVTFDGQAAAGGADDWIDDAGDVGLALSALATLRPADQELLRLALWEELAPAEIAVVIGTRVANVSVRLHRAKSRLRREFRRGLQAGAAAGHSTKYTTNADRTQEST